MGITSCGKTGHTHICGRAEKLNQPFMNDFGVLTNRKRALIALIHSLVFLGIAMHGFASPKAGVLLPGRAHAATSF